VRLLPLILRIIQEFFFKRASLDCRFLIEASQIPAKGGKTRQKEGEAGDKSN